MGRANEMKIGVALEHPSCRRLSDKEPAMLINPGEILPQAA